MDDATAQGSDRAEERIATGTMADYLASNTILLFVEGEGGEGGAEDGSISSSGQIKLCLPEEELHILELKRCGLGRADGVLTGPQEEEEGYADHVGDALLEGVRASMGHNHDPADNRDRHWFDPVGGRIGFSICFKHSGDTEIDIASLI